MSESDLTELFELAMSFSTEKVPLAESVYCFLARWSMSTILSPALRLTMLSLFSFCRMAMVEEDLPRTSLALPVTE